MRTLITDALLIDGTGGAVKPGSTIEIIDGRVGRIGQREDFGSVSPRAQEIIEARGRAVVPGLINAHEHIAWRNTKGTLAERVGLPTEMLVSKAIAHCLASLVEGVTTIRDLAGKNNSSLILKKAVADGLVVGPRIFTCGQALAITGGHASDTVARVVDGADNVRRAARELLSGGADLIKCMASGEAGTPGRDLPTSPQFTVDELRAAFDEAKDQGKQTTVHCISPTGMRRAIEAGVHCIEHGHLLDKSTAELLAASNVYLDPTLNGLHSEITYGAQFGRVFELADLKVRIQEAWESFHIAMEAGVKICAGVDALGTLFEEIELFVEGGFSPMQAITAATKTNAEVLGAADQLGTIETGKHADLLVVNGNPVEQITDLRNIEITMKAGVAYRTADLMKSIPPAIWYDAPRTKEGRAVLAAARRGPNRPRILGELVGAA